MNDVTAHIGVQRFFYVFLRITAGWIYGLVNKFHYNRNDKIKSKTFLLLGNHTMDMDPIYLVLGTRRHFKFVASENLLHGVSGFFIRLIAGPIPRVKGANADHTVDLIKKNLEAGISVAMFPEGNRTWDGGPYYVPPRTAKVVKESKGGLVTYRITGGYLKSPRWALTKRKGNIYGQIVHEYSREELDAVSEEEIYRHICEDIAVNAFEEEKKTGDLYKGERLAEGLHTALFVCPKCLRLGTTISQDNEIRCSCGYHKTYTESGWFAEQEDGIRNTLDWSNIQKKWLNEHMEELQKHTETPLYTDEGVQFTRNENGERKPIFENAEVRMYGDRMEIQSGDQIKVFPMSKMYKCGAFRNTRVFFTTDEGFFEIHRESIGGNKYFAVWRVLTGKKFY